MRSVWVSSDFSSAVLTLGSKWECWTPRMGHDRNERPADWDQLDNGAHYDLSRVAWRGEPWVCVQNSVVEIKFLCGCRWNWNWCWNMIWNMKMKIRINIYFVCVLTDKYSDYSTFTCTNMFVSMYCAKQKRKDFVHLFFSYWQQLFKGPV